MAEYLSGRQRHARVLDVPGVVDRIAYVLESTTRKLAIVGATRPQPRGERRNRVVAEIDDVAHAQVLRRVLRNQFHDNDRNVAMNTPTTSASCRRKPDAIRRAPLS